MSAFALVFTLFGFFWPQTAWADDSSIALKSGTSAKVHSPSSVILRPLDYTELILQADLEAGARSKLYPRTLDARIRPIAENKTAAIQELSHWANGILANLAALSWYTDQREYGPCKSCLKLLERNIIRLDELRRNAEGGFSGQTVDSSAPTHVALEELQLALERRAVLWRQALHAASSPSRPVSTHFSKTAADLRSLSEKTIAVESYFLDENTVTSSGDQVGPLWCKYLDTRSFIVELEATNRSLLRPIRRVSSLVSAIPIPMLVSFCDRANVILSRLDGKNLTPDQIAYLDVPAIRDWKEELERWTADTVLIDSFLTAVEVYEEQGGMSDMNRLFRLTTRLSFSRTESYKNLGLLTREVFGGSNVKIYISKVLVNHLLPPSEPQVIPFREVIQSQQVVGRRQTDLDIKMNFRPDPERLLLSLDVDGQVSTATRANAFATTLFNRGQAQFSAHKQIELTEEGFLLSPCDVRVKSNRLELRNFRTDFDGIPILSGVFRGVVQNQYEAKQGGAREETRRKIAQQVRRQVDQEADGRFREFNEKIRTFLSASQEEFDLFLEKKNSATEEHWLLTSWAIKSQDALSGNTPAPDTQRGAFVDLKIHESALNAILGKLEIAGNESTVGELKHMLAERFNRPGLAEPAENDDVQIGFAEYNPLTVRFTDGKIELRIAVDSLRLNGKTHRDFKVLVRYQPATTADGKLVLQRDRLIQLYNARSQFVLRAVFGKLFPAERPISLSPKFLEADARFEGLKTGHCRIEKGWFAVALIADETTPGTEEEKGELISDRLPVNHIRR